MVVVVLVAVVEWSVFVESVVVVVEIWVFACVRLMSDGNKVPTWVFTSGGTGPIQSGVSEVAELKSLSLDRD